jgi:hypothetical protein
MAWQLLLIDLAPHQKISSCPECDAEKARMRFSDQQVARELTLTVGCNGTTTRAE